MAFNQNESSCLQLGKFESVGENVTKSNDETFEDEPSVQCSFSPISRINLSPRSNGVVPNDASRRLNIRLSHDASFEHNQSLPCVLRTSARKRISRYGQRSKRGTKLSRTLTMERTQGEALLGCRLAAKHSRHPFRVFCPDFSGVRRQVPLKISPDESTGGGGVSQSSRPVLSSQCRSYNTTSTTVDSASIVGAVPWVPLESSACSTHSAASLHKSVMVNLTRAIFTVDLNTTQILMVNQTACKLLGYLPEELIGMKFFEFVSPSDPRSIMTLDEERYNEDEDSIEAINGTVIEMVSREGGIVPVHLWLRLFPTRDRGLAYVEPVQRKEAHIQIDSCGRIVSTDQETPSLFQYTKEEIQGEDLTSIIPAFMMPSGHDYLPPNGRKQKATGRTKYGQVIPLILHLKEIPFNEETDADVTSDSSISLVMYSVKIWVFSSISGLLILNLHGRIERCNPHFVGLLFGWQHKKLLKKNITTLIPNFGCDMEYDRRYDTSVSPQTTQQQEGVHEEEMMQTGLDSDSTTPLAFQPDPTYRSIMDSESQSTNILSVDKSGLTSACPIGSSLTELTDLANRLNLTLDDDPTTASLQNDAPMSSTANYVSCASNGLLEPNKSSHLSGDEENCTEKQENRNDLLNGNLTRDVATQYECTCTTDVMITCTSNTVEPQPDDDTSAATISESELQGYSQLLTAADGSITRIYEEGTYVGFGRHIDGTDIEIVYHVRLRPLHCGRTVCCVWISKNGQDLLEDVRADLLDNVTLASSFNSTTAEQFFGQSASHPSSVSVHSQCDDELVAGEYSKHYTTLQQIGKGAFGYVKMAFRKSDGLLVITKFIQKSKVHHQCWVDDVNLGRRVPLEISLLYTVRHPNIVQALDVFENESFFQMVMQKHGAGMDLFDFVDRTSKLEEPLISYIFRQIVGAVAYLHSLQILHRDIKDENIIIDQYFWVKLIDFGSATFMSSDRLFSTFYGTMEYCSPEVLAGNKYEGPQLEVWSLGVTLYVLTFGENPFFDVEETMRAELRPPESASHDLLDLLHSMLEKDPTKRVTIQELTLHPWLLQEVNPENYVFEELVNCPDPEWEPRAYHVGFRQRSPAPESVRPTGAVAAEESDEDDHTDLASSNSLTSLTPVDDVLVNSANPHGKDGSGSSTPEPSVEAPPSSARGLVSSTPFKARRSSKSPSSLSSSSSSSSTAGAQLEMGESTSVVSSLSSNSSSKHSSPSRSCSASSASSNAASSTSVSRSHSCSDAGTVSSSKQDADSLAESLLKDFSELVFNGAVTAISPIPCRREAGEAKSNLGEELSEDDFEDVLSLADEYQI